MKKKLFIGTSGWSYEHWKDLFYPDIPTTKWLPYYSEHFDTVEINTTFYHFPKEKTLKHWYEVVPKKFLFSVKANRLITHRKRLHECKELLSIFFKGTTLLKEKLGPILFQLPPSFKQNLNRLQEFIQELRPHFQYVFEFRHESWFNDATYDILRKSNIALCITDLGGHLSPLVVTADFVYIRLHGPQIPYSGSYGKQRLLQWKKRILTWIKQKKSVYIYFDNDEKSYAVQDAKTLKSLMKL
jgi:uncharacterized protein YecE (DUF72 family)